MTLTQAGFAVVEAVDGVDALAKVDASISMILCDINMPRMNGLDTIEKIRTDARWKALPVVMLTTEGQPAMIERASGSPFRTRSLVARPSTARRCRGGAGACPAGRIAIRSARARSR